MGQTERLVAHFQVVSTNVCTIVEEADCVSNSVYIYMCGHVQWMSVICYFAV